MRTRMYARLFYIILSVSVCICMYNIRQFATVRDSSQQFTAVHGSSRKMNFQKTVPLSHQSALLTSPKGALSSLKGALNQLRGALNSLKGALNLPQRRDEPTCSCEANNLFAGRLSFRAGVPRRFASFRPS